MHVCVCLSGITCEVRKLIHNLHYEELTVLRGTKCCSSQGKLIFLYHFEELSHLANFRVVPRFDGQREKMCIDTPSRHTNLSEFLSSTKPCSSQVMAIKKCMPCSSQVMAIKKCMPCSSQVMAIKKCMPCSSQVMVK